MNKLLVLIFLLFSSTVFAEEQSPDVCHSWKDVQKGHDWIKLTNDQWQFMRGVFVTMPNTPFRLPPGDKAYVSKKTKEGLQALAFIDGAQSCDILFIKQELYDILMQIGRSEILHAGNKS